MQLPSCSPHPVAPVRILRSDFQQYHQKQIFTTLKKLIIFVKILIEDLR